MRETERDKQPEKKTDCKRGDGKSDGLLKRKINGLIGKTHTHINKVHW